MPGISLGAGSLHSRNYLTFRIVAWMIIFNICILCVKEMRLSYIIIYSFSFSLSLYIYMSIHICARARACTHTHTHTHTQLAYSYLAGNWQSLNTNSGLLPPSPVMLLLLSGARQLFHPRICFTFFDEGMEVTTDHHTCYVNLKF